MIVTFYSYKGGVGRSMALANVAEWFRLQGLRVVMVDWDLEAPGLESFFSAADSKERKAIVGQAVPSYGPARAGQYFKKIECFCFQPQTLAAGEKRRMPVMFVLDPAIEKELHTVTLSYTFFNLEQKPANTVLHKIDKAS